MLNVSFHVPKPAKPRKGSGLEPEPNRKPRINVNKIKKDIGVYPRSLAVVNPEQ